MKWRLDDGIADATCLLGEGTTQLGDSHASPVIGLHAERALPRDCSAPRCDPPVCVPISQGAISLNTVTVLDAR